MRSSGGSAQLVNDQTVQSMGSGAAATVSITFGRSNNHSHKAAADTPGKVSLQLHSSKRFFENEIFMLVVKTKQKLLAVICAAACCVLRVVLRGRWHEQNYLSHPVGKRKLSTQDWDITRDMCKVEPGKVAMSSTGEKLSEEPRKRHISIYAPTVLIVCYS